MKDDGRFPLYLKILWTAVGLMAAVMVTLFVIPPADGHEGYGRIGLFLLLLAVGIPVFFFASLGTFLWFEVARKK